MPTKIAVISSQEFHQHLLSIVPKMDDIDIEPYIYSEPQQAVDLIKHLTPCDVVFFSGALPYYFTKEIHAQLSTPTLFLEQDETAIVTSLLSIIYHQSIPIERISMDLTDISFVKSALLDIGASPSSLHVLDYKKMLPNRFDIQQIIEYHHSLFQSGQIDIALTSIHAVYNRLLQLGVPAQKMIDPTKSVIQGLQQAKSLAELTKSQAATVAVGYFSLPVDAHYEKYLAAFVHDTNSSIQPLDNSTYILYSTRGEIELLMDRRAFHTFLDHFQVPIAVGFGYGATAIEAEQHAKIAYGFAKSKQESCGFILTEEKELLGPFPKEWKSQRLKNDHPKLLKIAKELQLSPANLSKIIQFSKSRQSLQFTAADLSSYLQITRRSTERILKKLVDHSAAKIVGEEMTYQQGRPRAVYELNLPIY